LIASMLAVLAILAIGLFVTVRFWTGESPSLATTIVVGLAIGLSVLPVIGYVVILTTGFSAAAIYAALALTLAVMVVVQIRIPQGRMNWVPPVVNKELIYSLVLPLAISSLSLLMRLYAVLLAEPLSEVDPWYWLYNTRILLATGRIDYSLAGAYPFGFVLLAALIASDTPSYEATYAVIRFIGPVISGVTTFAVFKATQKCFGGNWRVASIASIGFAVGNLLQFRGRIGTPETEALFLFVVFLSYLYIYEQRSMPLTALLFAGLIAVHPTTALVAFLIWVLSEFRIPQRVTLAADIRRAARYCVVITLLLLPVLAALIINTDVIARYAFYAAGLPLDQGETPLAIVRNSLDSLVIYSLGVVLFGVSLVGVLRNVVGFRREKWAYIGWGLCVLWALSAFIPVIFFRFGAPRAATFIVFPAMIIVGHVYTNIIDSIQSPSTHGSLLRSARFKEAAIVLLIVSAQVFYGCTYGYLGERYIPEAGLNSLEWIAGSGIDADSVFVYDSWVARNIAQAVLYPLPSFANDTLRYGPYSNLTEYIDDYFREVLVVVGVEEALYGNLTASGHVEVYNNAGVSVVLYNRP